MTIKKIAFVVKYFPTVSETFIVNQINGLISQGYVVDLYAYNKTEQKLIHKSITKFKLLQRVSYYVHPPVSKIKRLRVFLNFLISKSAEIQWLKLLRTLNVFKFGKEAYTLKLFFESQWFLTRNSYEIIHVHFGMNANRIAHLYSANILSDYTKLVTTFHGYDLLPNQAEHYQNSYAELFKYGHMFTVNTPYLLKIFNTVNKNQKPCEILPVGLDTSIFKRSTRKNNESFIDIIFCGRLINWKAPDLAIEIVSALHKKGFKQTRLHIVGSGQLKQKLIDQVNNLHIAEYVHFYGNISQEELIKRYEQSDIFLLPGRYEENTARAETQGLVIQEAQAMELPVVVGDIGGMKYGLIDEKTGFIIRENHLDHFVSKMTVLIQNPELRTKMGVSGRKYVIEHYDNILLTNKLIAIYKKTELINEI